MVAVTVAADVDDRLSPKTLEVIKSVVERLPESFDLGAQQAHQRSITSTLKFPADGVFAQTGFMEALLQSSTVVPTLYRNLVEARRLLQLVLEEGELGPEPVGQVQHFLCEET